MICPDCNKKIELTWKLYIKTPFNYLTCPDCSCKFKLARSAQYYLWLAAWTIITIIGGVTITTQFDATIDRDYLIFSWLILMFIIYLPIDIKMERRNPTLRRKAT